MRILMLGWEFPPFMAGGLGTACFGLTRALRRAGHDIHFVLPRAIGDGRAEHVHLIGPDHLRERLASGGPAPHTPAPAVPGTGRASVPAAQILPETGNAAPDDPQAAIEGHEITGQPAGAMSVHRIDAGFDSPYGPGTAPGNTPQARRLVELIRVLRTRGVRLPESPTQAQVQQAVQEAMSDGGEDRGPVSAGAADELLDLLDAADTLSSETGQYGGDLFWNAHRYARVVAALAQTLDFDVIHAHDWLAFPAGIAARAATGKPLLCQVHATEFDRSGEHINQAVYDIERAGVHAADRVIAVSRLTKEILAHRYAIGGDRIDVVWNGVDAEEAQPLIGGKIEKDDKIVLFLGRITMQKGPEYFIRAAARVLEKVENVKFVVAGSGDMAVRMIEEAAALGIGHKVLFTGFLRGKDVDEVYRMADCYVMPSVSEPFGIVALEAIRNDTPTIISKQSGVAEALSHALKVDFWDTNDMADKIVAVLRYPPLSQTLREHGPMELRRLTWADAARKVVASYGRAISAASE